MRTDLRQRSRIDTIVTLGRYRGITVGLTDLQAAKTFCRGVSTLPAEHDSNPLKGPAREPVPPTLPCDSER